MKISEDKLKEGRKLAKEFGFKELYLNEKGEFFTNKSYASMSVGYDNSKFAEVPLNGEASTETGKEKATNDLGKAEEVIRAIELAINAEAVVAILKAEAEGKKRPSVIKAGEKKLKSIAENATNAGNETSTVTLEAIESETELVAVAALLELEKLGKNRPEVIDAATKKIETLTNKAE